MCGSTRAGCGDISKIALHSEALQRISHLSSRAERDVAYGSETFGRHQDVSQVAIPLASVAREVPQALMTWTVDPLGDLTWRISGSVTRAMAGGLGARQGPLPRAVAS